MNPIKRATGSTESEQYLAKLGERSFLNLWSYPNVYIDKRTHNKGQGKELCDLLVVCGDHVLIFSDKHVGWPGGADLNLAWRRWFKRAVMKSVDQIRGAQRWLKEFPERIFLDSECTERLPLPIPPIERRKVHGIVVARGAREACIQYFRGGLGSFCALPRLKGNDHITQDDGQLVPFAVGDVDPNGPFVHVFDEATLDVIMDELDTIIDFTSYLEKKEKIIRDGGLAPAEGEEDLVAYYLTHLSNEDEHDFTMPDGKADTARQLYAPRAPPSVPREKGRRPRFVFVGSAN
jgi:hypothetical protein